MEAAGADAENFTQWDRLFHQRIADGKAQVHFGGSTDDLTGAVELELADAILKSPELSVMGGFKLTDLGVGTLTLKVKMNLKKMKRARIEDMVKGWFIGHFEPSLLKTDQFEVGLLQRSKGPETPPH